MAADPNITLITPPRVPLVDAQTGLVSREWYRFFLSLFNLTGGGQNNASLLDLQVTPRALGHEDLANVNDAVSALAVRTDQVALVEQLAELQKQVDALSVGPVLVQLAELQKQVDALSVGPALAQLAELQKQVDALAVGPSAPEVGVKFAAVTVDAASTDLPTVIALCNQLRTALIANGICI